MDQKEKDLIDEFNFWSSLTEKEKRARLQVITLWVSLMLACILVIIFIQDSNWKITALVLLICLVFFTGKDIRHWNGGK